MYPPSESNGFRKFGEESTKTTSMSSPRREASRPLLRLYRPSGTVALLITRWPVGSPEGDRIALTSDGTDETGEIYAMNADGSGLTRLTHDPAYDAFPAGRPSKSVVRHGEEAQQ